MCEPHNKSYVLFFLCGDRLSLFCDQTSYVVRFYLFIYFFFGGNTCRLERCVLVQPGHIALMKSSTDELWEHRSVIYASGRS